MKKQISFYIDPLKVDANKFAACLEELTALGVFNEITGTVEYDDSDMELGQQMRAIFDKYFLPESE